MRLPADRGQAVLDPVALLDDHHHRDEADLGAASPTRLPTTPSRRARSGPGTRPNAARPTSRRRDRDGMPGIVTTAVRHPACQSWASSRSRSSPRRRTSNFQFARNASIDSGFSGRWSGGDQK